MNHRSHNRFSKKPYSRESVAVKPLSDYSFQLLAKAEKLYGKRVNIFQYDGIEANLENPGIRQLKNSNDEILLRIQLPNEVLEESEPTVFALGQQLFHVMCYDGITPQNVLQAGAALIFADILVTFVHDDTRYVSQLLNNDERYIDLLDPYKAVTELLRKESHAIMRLREVQPILGKITKKNFRTAGIKVEPELLKYLLSPFPATA